MAPAKKATLQTAALTAASKGKIIHEGTSNVELHPQNPDVLQQLEERLSPATPPERTTNEPESRLPVRGQLLQLLAGLQNRPNSQEVEAAREREKAT